MPVQLVVEELLATRLALLVLVFGLGEADLVHGNHSADERCRYYFKIGTYSELPLGAS